MRLLLGIAGVAAVSIGTGTWWPAACAGAGLAVLARRDVPAVSAAGAAAIHFAVAPEHFGEWWGFGTFFVLCGEAQLAWALARRRNVALGVAGSAFLIALWAVSRVSGLPFGPEPWTREAVAPADAVAVALEVVTVVSLIGRRSFMRHARRLTTAVAVLVLTGALVTGALAAGSNDRMPSMSHNTKAGLTAEQLRVTLDNLLGEHAALAMNATNAGYTGSKSFPAVAKQLDANSVALSKAIGSIYGARAGKTFLDGKYMWRDHVRFFVAYTVALAKHDKAGQARAVANLKRYTTTFGNFLAGATGMSKVGVRSDLLGHVFELKDQLDAFAAGKYTKAASLYHAAYNHMFMTGDMLAAAIAKQKGLS